MSQLGGKRAYKDRPGVRAKVVIRLRAPNRLCRPKWTARSGSIRLLFALRQASFAQALYDTGVLLVEGRIVTPVDAGPALHGEVRIEFPQLRDGLLGLLVVAGPSIGGGEVDVREHGVVAARNRLAAPFDRLFLLGQMGVEVARFELPPGHVRIARTQPKRLFEPSEAVLAMA